MIINLTKTIKYFHNKSFDNHFLVDESSIDSASASRLLVLLRPVAGGGGLVYEQVRELTHQGSSILSSTVNRDIKYY